MSDAPRSGEAPSGGSASPWDAALAGRFARLDGVRGIAVLLVMLYHLCRYPLAVTPAEQAFTTAVSMGWTGVDLFFVLSGFLITGILLRQRESGTYFRTFYARRAIRIFPLYYAVLVLFLIVIPALTPQAERMWIPGSNQETIWYWVFLSNLLFAFTGNYQHHFLEITWSLAIEEQFYLLWPLLVWLTTRRQLVWVCAALVVGALLLRVAIVWAGAPNPIFIYTFTPCRIDELAMGALVAALATDARAIERLARWARPALWGAGGAFVLAVAAIRLGEDASAVEGLGPAVVAQKLALGWTGTPFMQTVGFTLLALAWAGFLVRVMVAAPGSRFLRVLEWPVLLSFGKYSYALYLLHVLGGEFGSAFFNPDRYPGSFFVAQLGYWAAAIGCSYGLALLSWYGLELHFQRLRRFLPYGIGAGPPEPPRRADTGGTPAPRADAPGASATRADTGGGPATIGGSGERGTRLRERSDSQ